MDTSSRPRGLDFAEGKTPFEIMQDVSEDVASRDRIALATSFSHGGSTSSEKPPLGERLALTSRSPGLPWNSRPPSLHGPSTRNALLSA